MKDERIPQKSQTGDLPQAIEAEELPESSSDQVREECSRQTRRRAELEEHRLQEEKRTSLIALALICVISIVAVLTIFLVPNESVKVIMALALARLLNMFAGRVISPSRSKLIE